MNTLAYITFFFEDGTQFVISSDENARDDVHLLKQTIEKLGHPVQIITGTRFKVGGPS